MTLNYIEFAAKIKEKYPQYKDIDDLTLAQKVVAKYPQYKETVIFDENIKPKEKVREIKPINWDNDYTPSGLAKRGAANISALLRMPVYGEDYKTAKQNAQVGIRDFEEKHPVIMGTAELINDLAAYSKLPIAKGGGAVNFIKNAAIQGGVPGLLEGIKENNAFGGAATGTGIGALVQGIAASGSGIGKAAGWLGNQYLQKAARLKPKTLEQVVKPDSKALDMTEDDVRKLLYDTAVRVRKNYKSVLNEKGNTVGNLLEELPETQKFKAADLKNFG